MIKRLLVVGYGSIGRRHVRILRKMMPEADIRVMRHKPYDGNIEFVNGVFSNLKDACVFSPQAAVIANPAPFHINDAISLANIGCHLLIEKPISDKTDNVEELIKLARRRNIILQIGYNLRFLLSLEYFRNKIQSGSIGRILSVRSEVGQYLPSWRLDGDYTKHVSAQKKLGGGVLLELSHEIDYLRWIFGEIEWVSAWYGKQGNLKIDVEDTALLRLGFKTETSKANNIASLNIDFLRQDKTRACIAVGELGSLRWDGITNKVDKFQADNSEWQTIYNYIEKHDDSYNAQWKNFFQCIKTGSTPRVTGEDGLAVLHIIKAIYASKIAKGVQVAIE